MKTWLNRHPLLDFYVFSYAYSWTVMIPLVLQKHGVVAVGVPTAVHYLSAFGPALAAFSICAILGRREKQVESDRRAEFSILWPIIGFASPLLLFAIAELVAWLFAKPTTDLRALGRVNFLPNLGISAWLLWLLTSGFGEELGWRGFALSHLQSTHSALASSFLLSIAWAGWHLPAFLYLPNYVSMGPWAIPGFFVGILAGSIVLTWLYNSSGGNVYAAVLWHASFNFVTASLYASGFTSAVTSILVIGWAAAVSLLCDSKTLTNRSVRANKRERVTDLPGDELIATPPHPVRGFEGSDPA